MISGGPGNETRFGNTDAVLGAAAEGGRRRGPLGAFADCAFTAEPHSFGMGGTGATAVMNVPRVSVMDTNTDDDMDATTIDSEGVDTWSDSRSSGSPMEPTPTLT